MSTISNRFFVTALEDGTTLHGSLSCDKPLTQSWSSNGTVVPDWRTAANQPMIWVTLLSGSTFVSPNLNNFTWYYNDVAIVFAPNSDVSTDGRFQKSVQTKNGVLVPALKIVQNLASADNVDSDTITFKGEFIPTGGGSLDFTATIQVRITNIAAGGYFGVLGFVNGIADITADNQSVQLYAPLYGGESGSPVSTYTCKWYVNEVEISGSDSRIGTATVGGTTYPALTINASDVVDHAVVKCEFIIDNSVVYTAFADVDDMQDAEFMYIQYNGANGNAASLRKGEGVVFLIWVGTETDATPDTRWNTFKVKLLDGDGAVITDTSIPDGSGGASSIHDPDANGWRTLDYNGQDYTNKARIRIPYDLVSGKKKNITGLLMAQTT